MTIALVQYVAASEMLAIDDTLEVTLPAPYTPGNLAVALTGIGSSVGGAAEPTDDGTGETWTNIANHLTSEEVNIYMRTAGDAFQEASILNETGNIRGHGILVAEFSGLTDDTHGSEETADNLGFDTYSVESGAITPDLDPVLLLAAACTRDDADAAMNVAGISLSSPFVEFDAPPKVEGGESGTSESGTGTCFAFGYLIDDTGGSCSFVATADTLVEEDRMVAVMRGLAGVGAVPFVRDKKLRLTIHATDTDATVTDDEVGNVGIWVYDNGVTRELRVAYHDGTTLRTGSITLS